MFFKQFCRRVNEKFFFEERNFPTEYDIKCLFFCEMYAQNDHFQNRSKVAFWFINFWLYSLLNIFVTTDFITNMQMKLYTTPIQLRFVFLYLLIYRYSHGSGVSSVVHNYSTVNKEATQIV